MLDLLALLGLGVCVFLQMRALAVLVDAISAEVISRLLARYERRLAKRAGDRPKRVIFECHGTRCEMVIPERCTIMEFTDARFVQVNECVPYGDGLAVVFVQEGESDVRA